MSAAHKSKVEGIGSISVFHLNRESAAVQDEKLQVRRNGKGIYFLVGDEKFFLKLKGGKEPDFHNHNLFVLHNEEAKWIRPRAEFNGCSKAGEIIGHPDYWILRSRPSYCRFTLSDSENFRFSGSRIGGALVIETILTPDEVRYYEEDEQS